jgi:hypothetical protein
MGPVMARLSFACLGLVGVGLLASGCASAGPLASLCGTWVSEPAIERWWVDGRGLAGEGLVVHDGVENRTEVLRLRPSRGGAIYVAAPDGQPTTEFRPIDPREARFGPAAPESDDEFARLSWANYAHDFPQEIHYRIGPDRLVAVVSGPDRESGWTFTRAAACQPPPTP